MTPISARDSVHDLLWSLVQACSFLDRRNGCTKFCLHAHGTADSPAVIYGLCAMTYHYISNACSLRLAPPMINHLTSLDYSGHMWCERRSLTQSFPLPLTKVWLHLSYWIQVTSDHWLWCSMIYRHFPQGSSVNYTFREEWQLVI